MQGGGGSLLSGCEAPAPVRASETGRARNWTMPPLRLEREYKERTNSATIDNRCVEFDRRESTQSTAIMGLRAHGQRLAFTMAEILLSLTIIGVVAAITLPSLTGNINERTWNTQRKALYARFSQAIALMPALNGYGTLKEETDSAGSTSIEDTAAETFVTSGLAKVLKINNICDSDHLEDCGIPNKITTLDGKSVIEPFPNTMLKLNSMFNGSATNGAGNTASYSQIITKAAAFETANGETIAVFYNPYCVVDLDGGVAQAQFAQPQMCANFIYDLNGTKGPNTVGKDIGFISVLYPVDSVVVAPMPLSSSAGSFNNYDALKQCKAQDSESRLPNRDELSSMFFNRELIGLTSSVYWSSELYSPQYAWGQDSLWGNRTYYPRSQMRTVRCVKR